MGGEGGGAQGVSQEIVVQSACQYDVTSRVSDFQKWRSKHSSRRRLKISILSRKYCKFRFLGFGDFKVSIVIEN